MPTPLELVWLDPKSAARIRKKAPWQQILTEAQLGAADPEDPALPSQGASADDRRDLSVILARAEAANGEAVAAALAGAIREDGKFAPPLVLVAGEIAFTFDELETLKALITTATPFTGGDDLLKAAVDAAKSFLQTPGLLTAPAVLDTLSGRIREAFGRTKRAVPTGYLEAQTERALLEQRHYQKRMFAGEPHLRALLQVPGDKGAMLVYVPAQLADKLPLFQRFGARLLAEGLFSADQYETHAFALRTLALARLGPEPGRRG